MKRSEQDLAASVVGWLQAMHWEVYQEVTSRGGPRCDIVATQGPLVWAIECKVSLGMAVLVQAMHWRGRANLVSVATTTHPTRGSRSILQELRIGALVVAGERCWESEPAPLSRLRRNDTRAPLRRALREEQKTFAPAGNAAGDYWTPFQATCKAVRDRIRGLEGGVELKLVVESINHHYASPKSARCHLARWIELGKVDGVRLRREGRAVFVEATA